MRTRLLPPRAAALAASFAALLVASTSARAETVWLLLKDGRALETDARSTEIRFQADGRERTVPLRNLLSWNSGSPASDVEAARITAGLAAVTGTDRAARDRAVEDLARIGLPAMTPLLRSYKDTDLRQPNPHYRLFERIVPGYADQPDRSLDLFRTANGATARGTMTSEVLETMTEGRIPFSSIRRLAVRRPVVNRTVTVDSLRHCTQIEFLDTGIQLSEKSRVSEDAEGFTRNDFDRDGWASDADGLKKPGPNYATNLVDGFPFGALVGKAGAAGPRWLAGKRLVNKEAGVGRLYLAVNDNAHWQNNVGSYRVRLRVSDAYDMGDPL
jgi:hypothetical protein